MHSTRTAGSCNDCSSKERYLVYTYMVDMPTLLLDLFYKEYMNHFWDKVFSYSDARAQLQLQLFSWSLMQFSSCCNQSLQIKKIECAGT